MIVINLNESYRLAIIPRTNFDPAFDDIQLIYTNETTKEVTSLSGIANHYINDILYIQADFDFMNENTFYNLTILSLTSLSPIYKDRIFCTSQNINTFSINDGVYSFPNIDNNAYITI